MKASERKRESTSKGEEGRVEKGEETGRFELTRSIPM